VEELISNLYFTSDEIEQMDARAGTDIAYLKRTTKGTGSNRKEEKEDTGRPCLYPFK